jgi:hypothetical protein
MSLHALLAESLRTMETRASGLVLAVDAELDAAKRESGRSREPGARPSDGELVDEVRRLARILGLLRSVEATLYVARDLVEQP